MSADNWTVCPKCKSAADAEHEKRLKAVEASYGKVPAEAYLAAVKDLEERPELPEALREDYQLGVTEDGEFYVVYRCSCTACDFQHQFRHEERLLKD